MNLEELKRYAETAVKEGFMDSVMMIRSRVQAMSLDDRLKHEEAVKAYLWGVIPPLVPEGTRTLVDIIQLDGMFWLMNEVPDPRPQHADLRAIDLVRANLTNFLVEYAMKYWRTLMAE